MKTARRAPGLPVLAFWLGLLPGLAFSLQVAAADGPARPASAAPAAAARANAPKPGLPRVRGVVHEVDAAAGLLVLQHEAIPNLGMDAMAMAFELADPRMLQGLKTGDPVLFQADMRRGEATILWLQRQR